VLCIYNFIHASSSTFSGIRSVFVSYSFRLSLNIFYLIVLSYQFLTLIPFDFIFATRVLQNAIGRQSASAQGSGLAGASQYCWLELGHPFPFLFSLDSFHMHRSQHLWHFDCSVPIFIFQMLAYVYNLLVYDIVYYLKLYFGISVFIHLVR